MLGSPWKVGGHIPHPRAPHFATLSIDVVLHKVFDLTDVAQAQVSLETTAQELTGDWDGYGIRTPLAGVPEPRGVAPTQELGRHLYLTGIEAFVTLSAKVPYHRTLVVFPQTVVAGGRSRLVFRDPRNPSGPPLHRIP
jgi:hypothetical protein